MLPDWLKLILFLAGYVALMRWVLPALGIPTCMSGACRIPQAPKPEPNAGTPDTRSAGEKGRENA